MRFLPLLPFLPFVLLFASASAAGADRELRARSGSATEPVQAAPVPAPDAVALRSTETGFVGGDDVVLHAGEVGSVDSDFELAAAANGDLYGLRYTTELSGTSRERVVLRSADDGESWQQIGDLDVIDPEFHGTAELFVVDGVTSRVYVLYRARFGSPLQWAVRVAFVDVGVPSPTWTVRTVMDVPDLVVGRFDLTDDSDEFSDYWLYAAVSAKDDDGSDIWVVRSTDFGETWTAPYRAISSTTAPSSTAHYGYYEPRLAYGGGGRLYLASMFTDGFDGPLDDAISYRTGFDYGASETAWSGTLWALTSTNNGIDEELYGVVADPTGDGVTVLVGSNGGSPQLLRSLDAGASWSADDGVTLPQMIDAGDIAWNDAGDSLYVAGTALTGLVDSPRPAYVRAPAAAPTAFSEPQLMGDHSTLAGERVSIDFHATRTPGLVFGYVGVRVDDSGPNDIVTAFDGAWRSGPGFPNYEPGFPVTVPGSGSRARTSPAVVDLDDDGQLEIVFANVDGEVYVIEPDGSIAAGWPVNVGSIGDPDAPVAVGDLNGDGVPSIVVGNDSGVVTALAPDGSVRPGFPVDLGTGTTTYVAVGALRPFYPRWIVALSGDEQVRINWRGVVETKSGTLLGTHESAPAVGDVDGDGAAEIVYAFRRDSGGTGVHVLNGDFSGGVQAFRGFTPESSAAVSLGDLDLDGDLEITVPLADGTLEVLHHDLSDVAGFPYTSPDAAPLTRVAVHNMLGTFEPELIFNGRQGLVHVVYADGDDQSGYPALTSASWFLFGAPIATSITTGTPTWVVVGSRDRQLWTFRNVGAVQADGWPRFVDDQIETSPAAGDLDGDGRNEIVFLGNERLHVIDVGAPEASPASWWTMEGADPGRTGCGNCDEDVVTSVEPQEAVAGRVELRLPTGNPVHGTAAFAFTLPAAATVELEVFDLRGRRVRTVDRRELPAGEHQMLFDGRDDRGARLARGSYLARLVVDDEVRRHATKKFVWMD